MKERYTFTLPKHLMDMVPIENKSEFMEFCLLQGLNAWTKMIKQLEKKGKYPSTLAFIAQTGYPLSAKLKPKEPWEDPRSR